MAWEWRTRARPAHAAACRSRRRRAARDSQVIGGGPSGACAAETLAKAGIETFLIERKMDNCKPCGGAIPLCMIDEFDLPMEIIDRKARAWLHPPRRRRARRGAHRAWLPLRTPPRAR